MSWAANRQTTRDEDGAYCLLGIFGIFMPLIYGEGKEHALKRLQREVDGLPTIGMSLLQVGTLRLTFGRQLQHASPCPSNETLDSPAANLYLRILRESCSKGIRL
jgi:hypothetical protein